MADAAAGFWVDSFRPASKGLVLSLQEELALIVVVISACGWPMFSIFFSRGFREAERLPCGLEAKLEIQEPCCGIFGHSRNRRLPCPAVEA